MMHTHKVLHQLFVVLSCLRDSRRSSSFYFSVIHWYSEPTCRILQASRCANRSWTAGRAQGSGAARSSCQGPPFAGRTSTWGGECVLLAATATQSAAILVFVHLLAKCMKGRNLAMSGPGDVTAARMLQMRFHGGQTRQHTDSTCASNTRTKVHDRCPSCSIDEHRMKERQHPRRLPVVRRCCQV